MLERSWGAWCRASEDKRFMIFTIFYAFNYGKSALGSRVRASIEKNNVVDINFGLLETLQISDNI